MERKKNGNEVMRKHKVIEKCETLASICLNKSNIDCAFILICTANQFKVLFGQYHDEELCEKLWVLTPPLFIFSSIECT